MRSWGGIHEDGHEEHSVAGHAINTLETRSFRCQASHEIPQNVVVLHV